MRHSGSGILVVAAAVAAIVPGTTARAAQPSCGDEITTSVKLTADLGPCPDDGLIVNADNVVIDLNGHRLIGAAEVSAADIGIDITNRSGVLVKNGAVTNFGTGIRIRGFGGNKVSRVSSMFNDAGDGILIAGSSNNVITKNRVIANGPFSGISVIALGGDGSADNQIKRNTVRDNARQQSSTTMSDVGIRLEANTVRTIVAKNDVSYNGLDGIALFDAQPDDATSRGTEGNTVSGNTLKSNGYHTKAHRPGDGIRVGTDENGATDPPNSNVLQNNVAKNSAGVDLHDTVGFACSENTWIDNRAQSAIPGCTEG